MKRIHGCRRHEINLSTQYNNVYMIWGYLHATDSIFPPWRMQVSRKNRKGQSKVAIDNTTPYLFMNLQQNSILCNNRYKWKYYAEGLERGAECNDSPSLWRWLDTLSSLWGRTRRSEAAAARSEAGWRPTMTGRALQSPNSRTRWYLKSFHGNRGRGR